MHRLAAATTAWQLPCRYCRAASAGGKWGRRTRSSQQQRRVLGSAPRPRAVALLWHSAAMCWLLRTRTF
eukprot:350383-Chlamydomonas_euryale.AAC.6